VKRKGGLIYLSENGSKREAKSVAWNCTVVLGRIGSDYLSRMFDE
jgi:hypothetical protein